MSSIEEFAAGCRELEAACLVAGRDRRSLHVAPFALEGLFRTTADRDRVAAAGADEMIVWIMARELDDILDELKRLAEELLDAPAEERGDDDD